jgi:serine/threonine protein kinase
LSTPSAQVFADELLSAKLFDHLQLSPYLSEFRAERGPNDANSLAKFLIAAGLMTAYQAERTLAGEAAKLVLGPYILIEPVGGGSLGTVFQAVGRSDRKRYAVKVLPLRSLWNVHMAKQQVQVFAQLPPHPAVVPFVDVDTSGGFHYLVWPYVMGRTLAEVVGAKGPRPTDQAVSFIAQIAEGLLLCHTHNVAHGLLKPSNLLIGNDGQARILDLGVGAILSENIADDESMLDTISTANAAMSMLDYASPETLNSPQLRAPTGDVYSLGCTLYFLLTGGMPFPEGNAVDKILAHQTQKPRPIREVNPTVPVWLEALTMQMMAKSPVDRPGTADVLAALLAQDFRAPKPAAAKVAAMAIAEAPSEVHSPAGTTPWLLQVTPRPEPLLDSVETPSKSEITDGGDRSSINLGAMPSDTDVLSQTSGPAVPLPAPQRVPIFSSTKLNAPATAPVAIRFGAPNAAPAITTHDLPPLPLPGNYVSGSDAGMPQPRFSEVEKPQLPAFARSPWRRVMHAFTFWKPHSDVVQLSVFGPPTISPGDNVSLQVFAHTPESFDSVMTLAKVFHQNGELLATGFVQKEVRHGQRLGLHLGVVNAGVDRSEVEITWRGQPQPRKFDLYVPWESPAGPSPTVLSAGLERMLSGRIAFTLHILPRRA